VDELALYKRVLTAAERTWLYHNGQGRAYADVAGTVQYHAVIGAVTSGTCPQGETCDQDQAAGQSVDNSYGYDANGNQTTRVINGVTLTLGYDAEGHMVSVSGPSLSASFVYDGDGRRVVQTINGETTYFVGDYYEQTGSTITKYYYAGSSRVAMKVGSTVHYLLGDHLGSTSLTTDASGNVMSELRYSAWGGVRYSSGSTPTDYTYTGQYSNVTDFGLMFYNARWYDPCIIQFGQPDTLIPDYGNALDWNRYAYARYNPLSYADPSGHWPNLIGSYMLGWANFGSAVSILQNPKATITQKVIAGSYATVWGSAHAALAVGTTGLGCGLAAGCAAAVEGALGIGAAANADGNPTNELEAAVSIGQTAIEHVTNAQKIASQLQSKADILNIPTQGDMGNLSNPIVQNALSRINEITSSPTSRIWSGQWISKDPVRVFEYIEDGIGIVREQANGSLVSIVSRVGANMDKLQRFVDAGKGKWLR
jgi:RHS repeat-associated protein